MMNNVDEVKDLLMATPGLRAWQLTQSHARSTQRYTVFARNEALRQVDTTRWHVSLHVDNVLAGKATLGESGFTVSPQVSGDELRAQIGEAVARARLVHNAVYTLPAPGAAAPSVVTTDDTLVESAARVVDEVVEDLRAQVGRHHAVELSSSEVFADYHQQRILNSLGLDVTRQDTELMMEYVLLLKNGQGEEQEIWQSPRVRLRAGLNLQELVSLDVNHAQDGLTARLPTTGTFDVVLGEEALDTLWDVFLAQGNALAKYEGWSRMAPGAAVIKNVTGETLTLQSDPTLPGGLGSFTRDSQGTPAQRVTLVEDNIFRSFVANKKYADLTGVPCTGPMGNVVVAPGKQNYDTLLKSDSPVYELLRFSQLSPNPISGSFSGEIRSGRCHDRGGCVSIKGGSVGGNVLTAFARAAFSKETVVRQSYQGPKGVKLCALTLTGS